LAFVTIFLRLLFLCLVLVSLATLSLCVGEVNISPTQALSILSQHDSSSSLETIVRQLRLPRLLIAALVGASLSVSGFVMQTISRNALAEPFLTGVSSGAALAVALALILRIDFAFVPLFAFAGGLLVSIVVARLAQTAEGLSVSRLLLGGVGIGAITGGAMTLLLTMNPVFSQTQGIIFWLAGGIAGRGWSEFWPASIATIIGIVGSIVLSKPLRLLSLGSSSAQSLGLNVPVMQWALLATSVLLCAGAVSVSGLVGFVGLIGPHITRNLIAANERWQILTAALVGASLVLASDLAARLLISGQELPLGTLLSLLGGPFFLWLLYQHKDVRS
jgi:iron complex transport system permease protein